MNRVQELEHELALEHAKVQELEHALRYEGNQKLSLLREKETLEREVAQLKAIGMDSHQTQARSITKCISPRVVCDCHDLSRYIGEVASEMLVTLQANAIVRYGLELRLREMTGTALDE